MSPGRSRIILSNASFDPSAGRPHIRVGDEAWPVRVVRHAQSRRYRLVSRQSLEAAEVQDRKKNTFRGNLHIADASKFWASSKYLVLVEQ